MRRERSCRVQLSQGWEGSLSCCHCSQVPQFWLKKVRRCAPRLRTCRKRLSAAAALKLSQSSCTQQRP